QVDEGAQAVVEVGQGGVGVLDDQGQQAVPLVGVQLGRGAAGVGLGGERAGFAAALEQAADPGGTGGEQGGELVAGAAALVAGADHPLAEVLRVGFHRVLLSYSVR